MPGKAKSKRQTKAKPDPSDALIDAALRLAAEQGWHGLGLDAIAEAAGVPLEECAALFGDKTAILAAYSARLDRAMQQRLADQGSLDPQASSARERLFDVVMTRLEVMAPDRPAVARIRDAVRYDPPALAQLLRPVRQSLLCILQTAGLDATGLHGLARVNGLAVLLARVMRVWVSDYSQDMGPTMAALDRGLLRIESALRYLRPLLNR